MSDLAVLLAGVQGGALSRAEHAELLRMSDAAIREGVRRGDAKALRALAAQISDYVDNDPLMQDIARQLARGEGAAPLLFRGSASWAPIRDPNVDWSAWGPWEAWEECQIGPVSETAIGPVPTGAWICWNAESGQATRSDPGPAAKQKAAMLASTLNEGKRTRVVPSQGAAVAFED